MTVDTAFAMFPVLTTERFVLRQIRLTDADALFEIFSDAEVMKFETSAPHQTVSQTASHIQWLRTIYEQHQELRWVITRRHEDRVIGSCGLHHFGAGYHYAEAGYDLNRAYWGQGIMLEAMSAVLDFGFRDLELHRIEAIIDDANTRSKNLLFKLGFQYEGNLRERYLMKGQFVDEYYYGLLNREWTDAHPSTSVDAS